MVKTLSREEALISTEPIILKDYDEVQLSDFSGIKAEFKEGAKVDLYGCQNIPSDINFESCSVVWIDCDNFEKLEKEGKCNFGNANVYICPTASNNNNANSSYYNTNDSWLLPEDKSAGFDYFTDIDKELNRASTSYALVPDYNEDLHISSKEKFSPTQDTVYGLLSDSDEKKISNYAKGVIERDKKTCKAVGKEPPSYKKQLANSNQQTPVQKSQKNKNSSIKTNVLMKDDLVQKNDSTTVKRPDIPYLAMIKRRER